MTDEAVQDVEGATAPAAESAGPRSWWNALRRLRLEEFLFLLLFVPSIIVTIWANLDLYEAGIRSRRIRGGLLRLAIVVVVATLVPILDSWRHRLSYGLGRSTVEFLRTFFPFVVCTAVYTNLHDTIRWINPNDIHDKLMAIEAWMFGGQPVVWAEQFITPARTEFFSLIYANFFLLTIVVSSVLWAVGRRREARETMLGIIVCFYSDYVRFCCNVWDHARVRWVDLATRPIRTPCGSGASDRPRRPSPSTAPAPCGAHALSRYRGRSATPW